MSWRRARVLITHLPPESATMTAMRLAAPPDVASRAAGQRADRAPWSRADMLVGQLIDEVALTRHVVLTAAGAKNIDPPKPFPRPGAVPRERRRLTADQKRAIEERMRARG